MLPEGGSGRLSKQPGGVKEDVADAIFPASLSTDPILPKCSLNGNTFKKHGVQSQTHGINLNWFTPIIIIPSSLAVTACGVPRGKKSSRIKREMSTSLPSLHVDNIMPPGASAALLLPSGEPLPAWWREASQEAEQTWVLDSLTKQLSQPWDSLVQWENSSLNSKRPNCLSLF